MEARPARVEDAAAIAGVHIRSWQAAYAHVFPPERLAELDVEQRRDAWERRLAAPDRPWSIFVAADETGRVVAFASGGESRDGDREGEVYAVYAQPEAWGTGGGRAVLTALVGALREAGFAEVVLWVLEDNPRARRFYEREGWRADGGCRQGNHLDVAVVEVRYRVEL